MNDATDLMSYAQRFGQHTFVAVAIDDDDPDCNVWRCTGCHGTILGAHLEDNLWQLHVGATCPEFAVALTEAETNHGYQSDRRGLDGGTRDSVDEDLDIAIHTRERQRGNPGGEAGARQDRPDDQSGRRAQAAWYLVGLGVGFMIGRVWR